MPAASSCVNAAARWGYTESMKCPRVFALLLTVACQLPAGDTGLFAGLDSGGGDSAGPHTGHTGRPDTGDTGHGDTGDTGHTDTGRTDTGAIDSSSSDSSLTDTSSSDSSHDTGGIAGGDSSSGVDTGSGLDTGDTGTILPSAPITLYAVRHAEKETDSDDPGLTEEGQARAEALAELMHEVPLDAIYATDLRRTQETVQPTADDHGLTVVTDIDAEEDLAAYILTNHGGDTLLHAGHSYTLPELFEALGVTEVPDDYDYGDLWIIQIDVDGSTTIEESHYGE